MSKLVINSCSLYSICLANLMTSLKQSSVIMDDVIVVKGCSEADVQPFRETLCGCEVTVIHSVCNHYDFNAVCGLYKYIHHPLIVANGYILIHDTCEATDVLSSAMKKLDFSDSNVVYSPPAPAANICAFGRNVLVRMSVAKAFCVIVSKRQAMDVEHERSRDAPPIHHYGRRVLIRPRRRCGVNTTFGDARISFFYPDFGIYKFVTMRPFKDKADTSSRA